MPLNTINDCVVWATARLEHSDAHFGHGCDNSRDEAIWATLHITQMMDRNYDEVADHGVTEQQSQALRHLVEQRIKTLKPLAYLVGEAWFAGFSFYIDPRAIVPRSHFGDLIQDGLSPWIQPHQSHHALDLCCGSGCIAIAMALNYPQLKIDAADIDTQALDVAKININRHEVGAQITTIQSDLFNSLSGRKYDLILCNPPYIATSELEALPREYLHEPRQAFDAGSDGLVFVRQILSQAGNYLSNDGYLLIELGNYANVLEEEYPTIPFLWLTSRSGESVVLLLSKQDIDHYHFNTVG